MIKKKCNFIQHLHVLFLYVFSLTSPFSTIPNIDCLKFIGFVYFFFLFACLLRYQFSIQRKTRLCDYDFAFLFSLPAGQSAAIDVSKNRRRKKLTTISCYKSKLTRNVDQSTTTTKIKEQKRNTTFCLLFPAYFLFGSSKFRT